MMRDLLISLLIRLLSLDLPKSEDITQDVEDGLLSQLWQNPAFRKRIADRDKKIVYMMAGGEGMKPEPRDTYSLHAGQRVENLLTARDAKKGHERTIRRAQERAKTDAARLAKGREQS